MISPGERWAQALTSLREAGLDAEANAAAARLTLARSLPLRAPLLGEMKAGKSELLGRLLGAEADAMMVRDVVEATARCVDVRYAPQPYCAVVGPGDEDWQDGGDTWEDLVRGRRPMPTGARLEVGATASWLAELGLVLADTPGLNSNREGFFEVTWSAATRAHLTLYAMPAHATLKKTDVEFLRSVKPHTGAMIIVLTQFDLVGARDYRDSAIAGLVEHVRQELAESFDIHPLAVVATSTRVENDEMAGVLSLREVIASVVGCRDDIRTTVAGHQAVQEWRAACGRLELQREALQRSQGADIASFRENLGTLEGQMILERGAADTAKRRVAQNAERLRLMTLNNIDAHSTATLNRIEHGIVAISSTNALESYATSTLRAEFDSWRTACLATLEGSLQELSAEGALAARAALEQHLRGLHCDLEVLLPSDGSLPEQDDREDEELAVAMDALLARRDTLIKSVEELKQGVQGENSAQELQALIVQAQAEGATIEYVPQYDPITLDQGKSGIQAAGRWAGKAVSVALMLAPIPSGGKLGQLLKALPGGAKLKQGINLYNQALRKRDLLIAESLAPALLESPLRKRLPQHLQTASLKKGEALGWFQKVVHNLSPETWGERLGGFVGDLVCPDKIELIENPEVKAEHQRRIKPYADRVFQLQLELGEAEHQRRVATVDIQGTLAEQARVEAELQQLAQERTVGADERRRRLQELRLLLMKTHLLTQAERQLRDREGSGWSAQLRQAVNTEFDNAKRSLETEVAARAQQGLRELQKSMAAAVKANEQGVARVEAELSRLEGECLGFQRAVREWEDT
jgi:hypothetical protein